MYFAAVAPPKPPPTTTTWALLAALPNSGWQPLSKAKLETAPVFKKSRLDNLAMTTADLNKQPPH